MLMNSWLKNLKARVGHKSARPKHRRSTYRPMVESLEDRCLLSTFTVLNTADSGIRPSCHNLKTRVLSAVS